MLRRMSHFPWKSLTPSSGGRGLAWVLKGRSDFQMLFWSVDCRRVVQYRSLVVWTAMRHWFRIFLASNCNWGSVRFLRWRRSAWITWHHMLLSWGFHHGAGLGLGLIHSTDASRAASIMVWILSAAHRASIALLSWLRSMPELMMCRWNSCQSAFCQDLWGVTGGGFRSRYRVQMAWCELESRLISCARIDCMMLPAEMHRSIMDGQSPLRAKYIGWPGLLWRKKL
jgi:hypothetical protein